MKKWFFDADYLQISNCDDGCPYEFSAPPTTGACEGLCVWRIDQGEHDGLGLGLADLAPFSGIMSIARSENRDAALVFR